jgi:hypothetical protein
MVAGRKVALGRAHAHTTVTTCAAERTLTIEAVDADTRTATPQASPSARKPT